MTVVTPPLNPQADVVTMHGRFGPGSDATVDRDSAWAYVRGLARTRYENFSVVTRLTPADLKDDFAAVYAYCRWSDDLGDEFGADEPADEAIARLEWWRGQLRACFAAEGEGDAPSHPVFLPLAEVARRRSLPIRPFEALIDAFVQDQTVKRYETWDDVVGYCKLSADPVGWIVLHLAGKPREDGANADLHAMSDSVCTALQLANHWQDVRRDLDERDRVYLPGEAGFDADELRDWARRSEDPEARIPYITRLRPLVERTQSLLREGARLPGELRRRGAGSVAPSVGLFIGGAGAILGGIERGGYTTLWRRPTVSKTTKMALVLRAIVAARLGGGRSAA